MTEERPEPRLGVLPDALIGRAVRDKDFRDRVLELRGKPDDLRRYLASENFRNLGPEALAFIEDLNPDDVRKVLREIDAGPPSQEIAGA